MVYFYRMICHEFFKIERAAHHMFSNPKSLKLEGIVVHDGVPGIGKTYGVIDEIHTILDKNPNNRVIYASPFLDELHRIAGTTRKPDNKTGKPLRDNNNKVIYNNTLLASFKFRHPESYGKGKLDRLKNLIKSGNNCVITHSLFSGFDQEIIDLITEKNYHLLIDEEPQVMAPASTKYKPALTSKEIETFINNNTLKVNRKNNVVRWDTQKGKAEYTRYNDLKKDCDNGCILRYSEKGKPTLIWRQNPESFRCFKTVQILTYQFKGSILNAYFDYYKFPYFIINMTEDERFFNNRIYPYHKLIQIHNTKGEWLIDNNNPFSVKWYKRASDVDLKSLKSRTSSFFKSPNPFKPTKSSSKQKLWTTFIAYKNKLAGGGYSKNFLAHNAKASNNYSACNKMAFLVNVYRSPLVKNYLITKKMVVDEAGISLSALLQWIFRGAIREGKPIHLFIPSPRMRFLLESWLREYGSTYDFVEDVKYNRIPQEKLDPSMLPYKNIRGYVKGLQPGLLSTYKNFYNKKNLVYRRFRVG